MDADDGTRLYRELTIAHKIPCELIYTGTRHIISVPLHAQRREHPSSSRDGQMLDLQPEDQGIVIRLGNAAGLIVETNEENMLIW